MLTAPALTLLFLMIVICLGAAFVWMFWEIEQKMSKAYRKSARIADIATRVSRARSSRLPALVCRSNC